MEALNFAVVFVIPTVYSWGKIPFLADYFPNGLAITETLVVSWCVMLILIVTAFIIRIRMRVVPHGFQNIVEAGVDFLNKFSKQQFGHWSGFLGPYMGTLFLYILLANCIGFLTPIEFSFLGHEYKAPFTVKPPTRDINVTATFGCITVIMTLVFGFIARGPAGWCKKLLYPVAFMAPFNIMEYGTRLLSLSLRLFGNMLGGMILMILIASIIPIFIPPVFSLYFDFFDGILQAVIFVFLSTLYISEACENAEAV
jgi:F-type H+-transporting ATPase subunit a